MEVQNKELFLELGIDIPTMMERFMNNEALYIKFLGKLSGNEDFGKLQEYVKTDDKDQALITSHNLKSLTGNLSLGVLHQLFTDQVRDIREGKWEEAVALMDDINKEYARIIDLLEEADI